MARPFGGQKAFDENGTIGRKTPRQTIDRRILMEATPIRSKVPHGAEIQRTQTVATVVIGFSIIFIAGQNRR